MGSKGAIPEGAAPFLTRGTSCDIVAPGAVDSADSLYLTDAGNVPIEKWKAKSNSQEEPLNR